MSANKIVAMAVLAVFVAGCRTGRSLSDLLAKWDPTINMPVVSFGQELTDGNMPPHLILLEASITDEEGNPRKVPRISVNGTVVETDGSKEDAVEDVIEKAKDVMRSIAADNWVDYKDRTVVIRADAGCSYKLLWELIFLASIDARNTLLLSRKTASAGEQPDAVLAFDIRISLGLMDKDDPDSFLFYEPEPDYDELSALAELAGVSPDVALAELAGVVATDVQSGRPLRRNRETLVESEYSNTAKMRIDLFGPERIVNCGWAMTLPQLDAKFEERARNPDLAGKGVTIWCCNDVDLKRDVDVKRIAEVLSILYKHGFKRYYFFSM